MKLPKLVVAGVFASVLLVFVPSTFAQQTISPGNVVSISVLGNPELSRTVTVNEDGTTDYPVLGSFDISGMTAQELTDLLTQVISRIVDRPRVFVNVSDFRLINVRVKGAVLNPGEVMVKAPADILDVIAEAGGVSQQADLRRVMILSERGEGNRREQKVVNVASYSAMQDEDYQPVRVEMGDLVVVPTLERQSYVRVLGGVRAPGSYVPASEANIIDLIYQAGGPTTDADMGDVRLVRRRPEGNTETEYDIRKLLKREHTLPLVEPGDVVIVGFREAFEDFSFWSSLVRDMALLVSSIVILSRI